MWNLTWWSSVWAPSVWQCWNSYNGTMFFIHRFRPCRARNQQNILTSRLRWHTILLRDLKRSKTMFLVLLNLWAFLSLLEDAYVWNRVSSTWEAGCFVASRSIARLMNCLPAMGLQPSYVMYKGMITAAAEVQGCQTCSVGVGPQPTPVILCIFKIKVTRIQSKGSTWHTFQTCM